MSIRSKDFAVCPWCGATGSQVSHLYDEAPRAFGPWNCGECRRPYQGRVNAPGDVTIEKVENSRERWIPAVQLLRRGEGKGALYFVMKKDRYESDHFPRETPEAIQDGERYMYEEHSCLTNWIGTCVEVIEDGMTDPHGCLTFVRCVDVPEDFDPDDADWSEIFPEAFGNGQTIEGSAVEKQPVRLLKRS